MSWIFMFSGLIAYTGQSESSSCSLELSPPRAVVKFGDSLSANCSSLSDQTVGIGWESAYGAVDLTTNVFSLPFKIDSVKDWVIEPVCYANLNDGEQCTQMLPVTVYKMPDSVFLKRLTPMEEGQQYDIQCDIVNVAPARNLSVIWHKGNKRVQSQTFEESSPSPVNKSSILTLTAHRDDDGAQILCEAKLNLWPVEQTSPTMCSKSHEVIVLYPPTFSEPANETLELQTGQSESSSCSLELSPPRAVVKFGDSLSANCSSLSDQTVGIGWESAYGAVDLTTNVFSLPFKIDSVKDWVIEPVCYANLNDGEQCTQMLPVTVYKMPDSVFLKRLTPMEEGQQYDIQCDIVNVAPARNLSVIWHKGNKRVQSQTFEESSPSPVNKSSILTLTAHRDDDGAQILCEAKLNLWPVEQTSPTMCSKSHEVIVLYPPTFSEPANETLELQTGKKITLNCTGVGNPMPLYHWQFPPAARENDKQPDMNQSILSPSFELPGVYICTASNSQGTRTKYFTVKEAPGRSSGTTAGIVIAVFAVLIFIVYVIFKKLKR